MPFAPAAKYTDSHNDFDTKSARVARIGVISDTHGLLRPEALALLQGCDHMIHGGDIGNSEILEALSAIAPLTVVRGNNDVQEWARDIPASARLDIGGVGIFVVHDIADAKCDRLAHGARRKDNYFGALAQAFHRGARAGSLPQPW